MPEYGRLLSPEFVSAARGRRIFAMLLGVALLGSVGLCAYASHSAGALISFRTALQISGCLLLGAVLVGFSARVAHQRRHLGEVTAAATAFFTGTAMLYVSHFQWSELPTAPATPLVVKTAPVWNPAAAAPPAIAKTGPSAAAGASASKVVRMAADQAPQPVVVAQPAAAEMTRVAVVAKEDACASRTGVSRLFCEERTRLERCSAEDNADPACPSVIPASPPR